MLSPRAACAPPQATQWYEEVQEFSAGSAAGAGAAPCGSDSPRTPLPHPHPLASSSSPSPPPLPASPSGPTTGPAPPPVPLSSSGLAERHSPGRAMPVQRVGSFGAGRMGRAGPQPPSGAAWAPQPPLAPPPPAAAADQLTQTSAYDRASPAPGSTTRDPASIADLEHEWPPPASPTVGPSTAPVSPPTTGPAACAPSAPASPYPAHQPRAPAAPPTAASSRGKTRRSSLISFLLPSASGPISTPDSSLPPSPSVTGAARDGGAGPEGVRESQGGAPLDHRMSSQGGRGGQRSSLDIFGGIWGRGGGGAAAAPASPLRPGSGHLTPAGTGQLAHQSSSAGTGLLGPPAPQGSMRSRRTSIGALFSGALSGLGRSSSVLHVGAQEIQLQQSGSSAAGGPEPHPPAADGGPAGPRAPRARRTSIMDFFTGGAAAGEGEAASGAEDGRSAPSRSGSEARRMSYTQRMGSRSGSRSGVGGRRMSMIGVFGSGLSGMFTRHSTELQRDTAEPEPEEPTWFTSLEEFMPLKYRYHQGRYMEAWFACAVASGVNYILKKYFKEKMNDDDMRGVKRVLAFAQELEHEHLVKLKGTWETPECIYIVEEYVVRGDLLQDSMSHPERYTERFMAVSIVHPLLVVLAYLHDKEIYHRALFPENLLLGRADKLHVGHFLHAVDARVDKADERIGFLDYMAPEMLAAKVKLPKPVHGAGGGEDGGALSARGARKSGDVSSSRPPTRGTSSNGTGPDSSRGGAAAAVSFTTGVLRRGLLGNEAGGDVESPRSGRGNGTDRSSRSNSAYVAPSNPWEWQECYDEKVDIWQVGCLVHELLCGSLPFETEDKQLAVALILWAEVNYWPDFLSPECIMFMKTCLSKDPRQRPSAKALMRHPWIMRHLAGETVLTVKELQDADKGQASTAQAGGWLQPLRGLWNHLFGVPTEQSVGGSGNNNDGEVAAAGASSAASASPLLTQNSLTTAMAASAPSAAAAAAAPAAAPGGTQPKATLHSGWTPPT